MLYRNVFSCVLLLKIKFVFATEPKSLTLETVVLIFDYIASSPKEQF